MTRSVRTLLSGLLLLGLAVVAVHQRLRVTFLGYEVRRLGAELEEKRAEQRRLEILNAERRP